MTGELEAVGNLTSVSTSSVITLTWQPPFSLNLTTAEPDIVYCVNIVNITNEDIEIDHLISNCSVFETYYNFVIVSPEFEGLFRFIITPRSNVEGAKNGTPNSINVSYYSLECMFIVISDSV